MKRILITGAAGKIGSVLRSSIRLVYGLPLACRFARLLPKPKSAEERIVVVARSTSERQLLQFFDIAAADHDIVGFKHRDQPLDHVFNVMTPASSCPIA
jgi:nucleoside-diphosphate-sugar epimerase